MDPNEMFMRLVRPPIIISLNGHLLAKFRNRLCLEEAILCTILCLCFYHRNPRCVQCPPTLILTVWAQWRTWEGWTLSHCGLLSPYCEIDLGQHWLRQWVVYCLTAPSHQLSQCWLIIDKVQCYSFEGNFTQRYYDYIWRIYIGRVKVDHL